MRSVSTIPLHRQRRRHIFQRQMRGGERDAQRPFARAGKHHHDARRMRTFSEVFSVAGEGNTGVVDRAFLQRRGDDSVETAGHRTVDSGIQQGQHIAPVGGIELACGEGTPSA